MAKEQESQTPQGEETVDKKQRKKEEKARKKAEKKAKKGNGGEGEEEKTGVGSKIAMFFVTLIIVAVWLVIIALLIKMDVGGFGSTVMTPLFKDTPYLNRILPDTGEEDKEPQISDAYSEYQTVDAAIARIKELEKQLREAESNTSDSDAKTRELKKEVQRLSEYEQNQKKFEEEKAKFYEEVVFGDQAPDISEYKKYYEEIDPANAENLYKQVVKQDETDQELQDYVKMYSSMKPKEAAAIFDTMTDNLRLVSKILENMSASASSSILGAMDKETAAKVTELMEPKQ
ncbi:MAG: MotE family protein [Lachnospiraceae bacterium]